MAASKKKPVKKKATKKKSPARKPTKKKPVSKKPAKTKPRKKHKPKKKTQIRKITKRTKEVKSGKLGRTGFKRSTEQRERDLRDIAHWSLLGHSQTEMARRISEDTDPTRSYTISFDTVSKDMKVVLDRWESNAIESIDKAKAKQMRRLDLLFSEAYVEWERSKTDRVKQTQKKITGEWEGIPTERSESTVVIEPKAGSPALMGKMIDIIDRQNRVLGIYDLEAPLSVPPVIEFNMTFEEEAPSQAILDRQKNTAGIIDIEAIIENGEKDQG